MELLRRIEKYLAASGTAPTTFGRTVVRDPRLVHDLRRGREPGASMCARIAAWLDADEQRRCSR